VPHAYEHKRIPSLVCKSLFILESKYAAHKVAAAAAAAFYYFNFLYFSYAAQLLFYGTLSSSPLLLLFYRVSGFIIFIGFSRGALRHGGYMIMWALQTGSI